MMAIFEYMKDKIQGVSLYLLDSKNTVEAKRIKKTRCQFVLPLRDVGYHCSFRKTYPLYTSKLYTKNARQCIGP